MSRRIRAALFVSALTVGGAAPRALAQTDQARVTGSVRDASGAPVSGASVTILNEKTGDSRNAVTGDQGRYLVGGLPPSSYRVQAAFKGFNASDVSGLLLSAGQELTLDVTLLPADQSETITVVGEPPAVDLSSARMGANVNERELRGL